MSQHEAALLQWAPAGEPLLDRLKMALREARARSRLDPITVVTPSFQSAFFLRRRLATDGSFPDGLFNVSFERLDDLAERFAPSRDGRPPLSRLRASELVHIAANDGPVRMPAALERIRAHPAFQSALHVTFEDLRAAPDATAAELSKSADPVRRAVGGIWGSYRRGAERFDDRLDVARRAAEATRGGSPATRGLGHVIVLAIEEPAPQYRPFMEALMGLPGAVTLAAATGDDAADGALRLPGGRADEGATALHGTRLVSVPDGAEEARWIVRDILRYARGDGLLGRVAVLYGTPLDGARLVEALRVSDIPVSGPNPATLAQEPEGRWLLGVLRLCAGGLSREAVAAWITGSPVADPACGGRAVPGSRWDALSRVAGIVGGVAQWRSRLRGHAARSRASAEQGTATGELSQRAAERREAEADETDALARFIDALAQDIQPPPDGSRWSEFAGWLRRLYERYIDRGAVQSNIGDDAAESLVESLLSGLDELDELGGGGPDLTRLVMVVQEELDRPASAPRERGRAGFEPLGRGVFVAPIRQAAGCDFDRVYITGMAEGRYPSRPAEDPLLPDAVRAALDPAGTSLPRRSHRRASARRRYLAALATAPERVLLWPRGEDGSQRTVGPALWFMESARRLDADGSGAGERRPLRVADILGHRAREWLTVMDTTDPAGGGQAPGDRHEYDVQSVAAWASRDQPPGRHFLAGEDGCLLQRASELEAGRYGPQWSRFDGDLTGDPPGAGDVTREPVSPTRLETWATCPFRYFLSYVLRVAPIETPEEALTISRLDRGSLVHKILERFLQVRRDGEIGGPLSREDQEALLLAEAEATFSSFQSRGLTGHPALWASEKRELVRQLRGFLGREAVFAAETGTAPTAWEMRFGLEASGPPPVEVEAPGVGTLKFRGVIDRVDLSEDGARAVVSDYKTGSPASYRLIDTDPVGRGKLLQLPVYSAAVRARWPEVTEIEAAYWFVFESGRNERIGADAAALERAMGPVVARIVDGIGSGLFPARPGEAGFNGFENCRICDFDRVCPARRDRLWDRKRGDPRLAGYVELAEGGAT